MSVDLAIHADRDDAAGLWSRFREQRWNTPGGGVSLDLSRVRLLARHAAAAEGPIGWALAAMASLEQGGLANGSEGRMVGHYWLRAPQLAPDPAIQRAIEDAVESVQAFARSVHEGSVRCSAGAVRHVVHVGVGGSANGPQLVCDALGAPDAPLALHFLDNNDPDGLDRLERRLAGELGRTLVSVVSKSGLTPTPNHVLSELRARYARQGLELARHAVATTMPGTILDDTARREGWLARFPLWDWVGGRTSVTSAVGLLPLALAGGDVAGFLRGAAAMDERTRQAPAGRNPAALLALAWHLLGEGVGSRRMVVLPYRDRLALLPRYLQQLVMESLGKRLDRQGAIVEQGLTVLGNKGSSDQHSILQQLRDGTPDAFVTFVRVRAGDQRDAVEIEPGVTLEDHLLASLEGTRTALFERGRDSITLTLDDAGAASLGALIALLERAVGLYAELVDVNAYDQPGVDKHAAAATLALQGRVRAQLMESGRPQTAEQVALACGEPERVGTVSELLEHLADTGRAARRQTADDPAAARFSIAAAPGQIVLAAGLAERLVAAIRERHPRKSFGYLLGDGDPAVAVDYVLFDDNERNEPEWKGVFEAYGRYFQDHDDAGFVASPEESWRVQKEVWARGLEQVGVFHSHRRHPGNFSLIDHDLHTLGCDGLWHLIVSMRNPALPQLRAFAVEHTGARELDVLPQLPVPAAARRRTRALAPRPAPATIVTALEATLRGAPDGVLEELLGERFLRGRDERYAELAAPLMFPLEGGRFLRGSERGALRHFCGEAPRHPVDLSPFLLAAVPVTNELYGRFDPSRRDVRASERTCPAVDVSWHDAALFALWVGCRLPSEAEWEQACGAGSPGEWCCQDEAQLPRHAWYGENAGGRLQPVATRQPNAFGLHDLHGGVWEWCADAYQQDAYERAPLRDPVVLSHAGAPAPNRSCRGGSVHALAEMCRTRYRLHEPAAFQAGDLGFRLARSVPQASVAGA